MTPRDEEPELQELSGKLEHPQVGRSIDLYREKLTNRLLYLFGATVILDFGLALVDAITGHPFTDVRDALREVIPAETGLLGAAIGCYFGERAAK